MRFGWYVSVSSEGSELLVERETIEEEEEDEEVDLTEVRGASWKKE